MKAILWNFVFISFLVGGGGNTSGAAERFEEEIMQSGGHFRTQYEGRVTAVERDARGGVQVRIRATAECIWSKDGHAHEGDRTISKVCVLHWTQTEQPVPFAPGIAVYFAARSDGQVTTIHYSAALPFYRKRADGLIEVLLHADVGTGAKRVWIRALPTRVNLMGAVDVFWSCRLGLVMTVFDADGPGMETESLRGRDRGLPVANVPGERIQIGRDGWKRAQSLDHERSKTVVPPRQYISAAG